MSLSVRIGNRVCGVRTCNCNTAGVVVLDDGDRRLIKIVGGTQGGIGVHIVVVAHHLAVNLLSLGDTGDCCRVYIQSRTLMWILAVAQGLAAFKAQTGIRGPEVSVFILLELRGGPGSDGGIVSGSMGEGTGGQTAAFLQREPTIPSGGHGPFVVFGVYHDGNRIVILRGGTHHRGAADIDFLDNSVLVGTGCHGLCEGV